MIKTFTFKNFLSFRDEVKFSLERDSSDDSHNDSFFSIQDVELLKSAVIYGANASGKSNFSKAFVFFHNFIVTSYANALSNRIPTVPFLLNSKTENEPSFFEIELVTKDKKYIYGFEVSQSKVSREWLDQYPQKKNLFDRIGNEINSNKRHFKEATTALEKQTKSNVLFLSKLAADNGPISNEVIEEIKKINVYPAERNLILNYGFSHYSKYEAEILSLLQEADFNIEEFLFEQKEMDKDEFTSTFPSQTPHQLIDLATTGKTKFLHTKLQTIRTKYDDKGNAVGKVAFDFMAQESGGTQQMFGFAGLFLNALKEGKTLFIDELDSSLHPVLCRFIVQTFNSKKKNPKNAQLIFTTHDSSLLDNEILRRDQIFFIEKDKYGASNLFSLSSLGERKDLSYRKRYFEGRYGALPYIKSNENQWE
ncbi:ATP-binding protein [Candidatus Peregrinibacteria bacterium]|nr:ATP-binding protein [Candidatus Peregrinibacteria bacterium]